MTYWWPYRRIRLFLAIAWRDWEGRVSIRDAWLIASRIWYPGWQHQHRSTTNRP